MSKIVREDKSNEPFLFQLIHLCYLIFTSILAILTIEIEWERMTKIFILEFIGDNPVLNLLMFYQLFKYKTQIFG